MRVRSIVNCAGLALSLVAGPALGKGATPNQPANNPGTWITSEDYPPSALHDAVSGMVAFMLKVGPDGLPTACTITGSSGSALLDDTACSLISKRARFEPAHDADGKAVESTYASRVNWVLPQTTPAPLPSNVELSFVIGKDGSVSDCMLADAKGVPAETMGRLTDPCMEKAYDPYVDDKGKPVARKVTMRVSVTIEAVK